VPREAGVVCGLALLPIVCKRFSRLGNLIVSTPASAPEGAEADGRRAVAGETIATVAGPRAAVLSAERTILNFLGRMSGVATETSRYVEAARRGNPAVEVLDTRKTLPGWRALDKYAVRCGGGVNHRSGLYDAVLIKDNHIAGLALGALGAFLKRAVKRRPTGAKFFEVEVDSVDQLGVVLAVPGIDIVLLDNFGTDPLRTAVAMRDERGSRGKVLLESSGGVTLESIGPIAATGVDRISVGAVTHSARCLDIGLDLD
jgi:nicotinate-nucleotide pyrophosphorylase (carboxylating)